VVVLNKQVLDYVEPVAVNPCVLVVCAAYLAAIGVPLSSYICGLSVWASAGRSASRSRWRYDRAHMTCCCVGAEEVRRMQVLSLSGRQEADG
jgi:hypothetical protein